MTNTSAVDMSEAMRDLIAYSNALLAALDQQTDIYGPVANLMDAVNVANEVLKHPQWRDIADAQGTAVHLLREDAPYRVWHNRVNLEIRSDVTDRRIATFHKALLGQEAKVIVAALNAFLASTPPVSRQQDGET